MKRLLPAALIAAVLPVAAAVAQDRGADRPARNPQPAARVQPTAAAAGEVVARAKALPEAIELSGVFEPATAVEVKIDLETFNQPLKVKQAAGHGQQVKKGDVLLAVEPDAVQRALAAAESKKALADVGLSKARTDAEIGDQSDALAKRAAERTLRNAQEALSWFDSVDGEQMLKQAEMMVERGQDGIEDQEEEIAQLQKMYQSEELTEATADIVVKRALRQLRYAKEMLELTKKRAQKTKEKDYADARQNLVDGLDAQNLAIRQLENDQAARKAQRDAALVNAEEAARQATEAYEKLKADADKLEFVAPDDGYVFVGQLSSGNWTGADPSAVEPGKEIKPDQTVMTFFRPGAMQIKVDLPEADRFRVKEGSTAKVTPNALPDTSAEGKVTKISPLAIQKGPSRVFEVTVELAKVDDRVAPGFGAKVEIAAEARAYPMVPASYVKDGKLRVKQGGTIKTADVKTGKADGDLVQITEGLEAGATVLPPEPQSQPGATN